MLKKLARNYLDILHHFCRDERIALREAGLLPFARLGQVPSNWAQGQVKKRGSYYDSRGLLRLFATAELERAHAASSDFWNENLDNFLVSLQSELETPVLIERQRLASTQNLLLYFDSLLLPDPFLTSTANPAFDELHGVPSQEDGENAMIRWSEGLGDFLVTVSVLELVLEEEAGVPLIILLPDKSILRKERAAQLASQVTKMGDLSWRHLRQELDLDEFDDAKAYVQFVLTEGSGEIAKSEVIK